MTFESIIVFLVIMLFFIIFYKSQKKSKAIKFIKKYDFPTNVIEKLRKNHPHLNSSQEQQVIDSLKQFFIANILTKEKLLMPSKLADDLWHLHIKEIRSYSEFCRNAFGKPLNHYPVLIEKDIQPLNNLTKFPQRILYTYVACKHAQKYLDSSQTVPILFLLDLNLNVKNGFFYTPDVISRIENQIKAEKIGNNNNESNSSGDLDFDSSTSSCSSCGGDLF